MALPLILVPYPKKTPLRFPFSLPFSIFLPKDGNLTFVVLGTREHASASLAFYNSHPPSFAHFTFILNHTISDSFCSALVETWRSTSMTNGSSWRKEAAGGGERRRVVLRIDRLRVVGGGQWKSKGLGSTSCGNASQCSSAARLVS